MLLDLILLAAGLSLAGATLIAIRIRRAETPSGTSAVPWFTEQTRPVEHLVQLVYRDYAYEEAGDDECLEGMILDEEGLAQWRYLDFERLSDLTSAYLAFSLDEGFSQDDVDWIPERGPRADWGRTTQIVRGKVARARTVHH